MTIKIQVEGKLFIFIQESFQEKMCLSNHYLSHRMIPRLKADADNEPDLGAQS
jgi:hypothetical protein